MSDMISGLVSAYKIYGQDLPNQSTRETLVFNGEARFAQLIHGTYNHASGENFWRLVLIDKCHYVRMQEPWITGKNSLLNMIETVESGELMFSPEGYVSYYSGKPKTVHYEFHGMKYSKEEPSPEHRICFGQYNYQVKLSNNELDLVVDMIKRHIIK